MNLPLWAIFSITVSCFTVALAAENQNSKKNNSKNPLNDDITLDDEDAEGSGYEESRDLESSGSGYGPDDEDAAHGSDTNSKPGPVRGSGLIPMPATSAPSSPPSSTVNHLSESIPRFDKNSKVNPVEPASNENKNILRNNNPDEGESETENRALFPKEPFDNHHPDDKHYEDNKSDSSGVSKVNTPDRDRATSFFAQPGILAAVIGGAVVGLLCAILVVMFIVYRMRKKDEGSYPLEEMKRCPASNPYMKPNHREFFA